MAIPTFKKGQTFNAVATYTTEAGWPADLAGVSVLTSLKDSRGVLFPFDVTLDSTTQFTVRSDDTDKWHSGTAYWDIRFTENDIVFYSDTVLLTILPNVTPAPTA